MLGANRRKLQLGPDAVGQAPNTSEPYTAVRKRATTPTNRLAHLRASTSRHQQGFTSSDWSAARRLAQASAPMRCTLKWSKRNKKSKQAAAITARLLQIRVRCQICRPAIQSVRRHYAPSVKDHPYTGRAVVVYDVRNTAEMTGRSVQVDGKTASAHARTRQGAEKKLLTMKRAFVSPEVDSTPRQERLERLALQRNPADEVLGTPATSPLTLHSQGRGPRRSFPFPASH
ncbi:hypothetical protein V8C26DRAFT_407943 [Trichoderma gracile]